MILSKLDIFLALIEVYPISDVTFSCAPTKKLIKSFYGIFLIDYPVVLKVIIFSHFLHVFLDEIIDVLTHEIHIKFPKYLLRVLFIDYILKEKHKK